MITICVGPGSVAAEVREHLLEDRDHLHQQQDDDADRDDQDRGRIDHRALHLARAARPPSRGRPRGGSGSCRGCRRSRRPRPGSRRGRRRPSGACASASAKVEPCSTSFLHLAQDLLEGLVAPAGPPRISRHCTSGRPASIIVANWRVKIDQVLGRDARLQEGEDLREVLRLLLDLDREDASARAAAPSRRLRWPPR